MTSDDFHDWAGWNDDPTHAVPDAVREALNEWYRTVPLPPLEEQPEND